MVNSTRRAENWVPDAATSTSAPPATRAPPSPTYLAQRVQVHTASSRDDAVHQFVGTGRFPHQSLKIGGLEAGIGRLGGWSWVLCRTAEQLSLSARLAPLRLEGVISNNINIPFGQDTAILIQHSRHLAIHRVTRRSLFPAEALGRLNEARVFLNELAMPLQTNLENYAKAADILDNFASLVFFHPVVLQLDIGWSTFSSACQAFQ
ncbi:hypothetical protein NM208_g13913 [Fusarium decemcellulare]|uniref:Uncharacterized protein n=1 Tax=Fusarium decemcellulare TaxID=57161 RepID=A0ACC1RKM4_9HYPO|nr:hypothetical protein NM208_g13913 [Fusarium decemcellulare]